MASSDRTCLTQEAFLSKTRDRLGNAAAERARTIILYAKDLGYTSTDGEDFYVTSSGTGDEKIACKLNWKGKSVFDLHSNKPERTVKGLRFTVASKNYLEIESLREFVATISELEEPKRRERVQRPAAKIDDDEHVSKICEVVKGFQEYFTGLTSPK